MELLDFVTKYGLGAGTVLYFLWDRTKELAAARKEIKELQKENRTKELAAARKEIKELLQELKQARKSPP